MADGTTPEVGARIVVEGADQAQQNWEKVTAAQEKNTQATIEQEKVYGDAQRIQDEYFASVAEGTKIVERLSTEAEAFSNKWRAAFMAFRDVGRTPAQAMQELNDAVNAGIGPNKLLNTALNERFAIEQQLAAEGKSWVEIQKEMAELAERNAQGQNRVSAAGIQSSRAFFALTLASFGLMSITQELKKSFGDDLPQAFEKTSNAVQQIASFGSAGAFIGGGVGAVIGGIVGGLLALTTAALTLDPPLQRLNQSFQNMSKQDELIKTLADIGGVSEDTAEIWLKAAQKDPNFADYLEDIVKKGEPVPGLIASIHEASRLLIGDTEGISKFFGEIGETANRILLLGSAGVVGLAAFTEAIKAGKSVQDAYDESLSKTREYIYGVVEATQGQGIAQEDANEITKRADAILADHEKMLEKAARAQEKYNDAINDANSKQFLLSAKLGHDRELNELNRDNALADAHEQYLSQYAQAEQGLTDRLADLWQGLGDKLMDIQSQLNDRIADISSNLSDKIYDIQSKLADRLSDIESDLADKIADIQLDLANKLAELAHDRERDMAASSRKIEEAARDLARKLYEIERDRIEAINALDFNTGEQLRKARTEHDRQDILRRHQFEQSQIDQKANDARQDAMADFAEKLAAAAKEKQLAEDNYNYEVMLAKRLASQKIAEAEREAQQARQIAQREAAQQMAAAQREAEQQRHIAEREAEQARLLARRNYEEEVAQAHRTRDEQVKAAHDAEAARQKDIQRTFEERNKALLYSYELERAQIELTRIKAYQAYIQELQLIGLVAEAYAQMLNNLNSNYTSLGKKLFNSGIENFIPLPSSVTGGYNGMEMDVPPGHPGDTYMIGARTGEHVSISPPGTSHTNNNKSMTFNIYDASNPYKVRQMIAEYISEEAWR